MQREVQEQIGFLPEQLWFKRLALEYQLIRNYEPTFDAVDGDLTHYKGVIVGTGYYEGGFFLVEIFLDRTFPYTPPRVVWHTRIWHPNFTDESPARICESILTKDWEPNTNVIAVIEALKNLLSQPQPRRPAERLGRLRDEELLPHLPREGQTVHRAVRLAREGPEARVGSWVERSTTC